MRAATVVIVGIAAALLAPVLAAPRAESHALDSAPVCPSTLALPEELNALVRVAADGRAPCRAEIVFMTTPLTLVEISARGIAHIWAQPAPAPNARIEKAHQVIRQAYEAVMDGLDAVAGNTPATDDKIAAEDKPAASQ
ncbi:MAG: hypothetical protein V4601_13990 [Pseudomonadota bacterium]